MRIIYPSQAITCRWTVPLFASASRHMSSTVCQCVTLETLQTLSCAKRYRPHISPCIWRTLSSPSGLGALRNSSWHLARRINVWVSSVLDLFLLFCRFQNVSRCFLLLSVFNAGICARVTNNCFETLWFPRAEELLNSWFCPNKEKFICLLSSWISIQTEEERDLDILIPLWSVHGEQYAREIHLRCDKARWWWTKMQWRTCIGRLNLGIPDTFVYHGTPCNPEFAE